jgi:hypothetical protein
MQEYFERHFPLPKDGRYVCVSSLQPPFAFYQLYSSSLVSVCAGMFLVKLLVVCFGGLARVGPVKERLNCGGMGECKPKLSGRCLSIFSLIATVPPSLRLPSFLAPCFSLTFICVVREMCC